MAGHPTSEGSAVTSGDPADQADHPSGGPAPGGQRPDPGQDHHLGVRLEGDDRHPPLRDHPQPLEPRPHPWRFLWRGRSVAGRRGRGGGPRQRRRGLDPDPGQRTAAWSGSSPRSVGSPSGPVESPFVTLVGEWAADPVGRGCRPAAQRLLPPRPPGLARRPPRRPGLAGRDQRRPGRPEAWPTPRPSVGPPSIRWWPPRVPGRRRPPGRRRSRRHRGRRRLRTAPAPAGGLLEGRVRLPAEQSIPSPTAGPSSIPGSGPWPRRAWGSTCTRWRPPPRARARLVETMRRFHLDHSVLLTPTMPTLAPDRSTPSTTRPVSTAGTTPFPSPCPSTTPASRRPRSRSARWRPTVGPCRSASSSWPPTSGRTWSCGWPGPPSTSSSGAGSEPPTRLTRPIECWRIRCDSRTESSNVRREKENDHGDAGRPGGHRDRGCLGHRGGYRPPDGGRGSPGAPHRHPGRGRSGPGRLAR